MESRAGRLALELCPAMASGVLVPAKARLVWGQVPWWAYLTAERAADSARAAPEWA